MGFNVKYHNLISAKMDLPAYHCEVSFSAMIVIKKQWNKLILDPHTQIVGTLSVEPSFQI